VHRCKAYRSFYIHIYQGRHLAPLNIGVAVVWGYKPQQGEFEGEDPAPPPGIILVFIFRASSLSKTVSKHVLEALEKTVSGLIGATRTE